MNWIAQTGHVAAKDVRHARWSLIAYLAMLAAAVFSVASGRALGPYWTSPSTEVLGMRDAFVVFLPQSTVLLGLIVAASLVQMDSPTRATAFWASRPLSPSAVLGSKIVLVLMAIIALPLLGEIVVLRSMDTSAGATASMVGHAALAYAQWLLAAMIIGALTDDLRAFVGVFVAVLVGLLAAVALLQEFQSGSSNSGEATPEAALLAIKLTTVAAGCALLAFVYRHHDRRRWMWAAGITVVACLVAGSFATVSSHDATAAVPAGPPLEIQPVDPAQWSRARQLQIRVSVRERPDSARLVFQADTMRFETSDGSVITDKGRLWPAAIIENALPPVGKPVRWIVDHEPDRPSAVITQEPSMEEQPKIAAGVKAVTIDGVVTVYRPHIAASLPLREDASATAGGRRVTIYGLSHGATGTRAWVNVSEVVHNEGEDPVSLPLPPGQNRLEFAVVNAVRGEAMLIDLQNASGQSGSIVLPWTNISSTFTGLRTNVAPDDMASLPRDDAWYAGARLVVIEWTPASSYRTSGHATVPLTDAPP